MTWREIREADLPVCLALQPGNLGDEIVGRETAVMMWKRLLGDRAFRGIVIEDGSARSGSRIIGVGAGVFVRPDFMTTEIGNPRPGVKARILASLAHGASVLLQHEQVGAANAGDGVDIVSLMGSWRQRRLNRDELGEMSGLLAESFFHVYRGYRLHRFLQEINGPEEIETLTESKIFRFIGRYPELDRATALLTKQDAVAVPYSFAISMFHYEAPVLRLRETDQQLLLAALGGRTDAELSADLGVPIQRIKKRWISVFERIAQTKPELFAAVPPSGDEGRGPQKRHHVLSYVRAHPEELRPYDWGQASRAR